MVWKREREEERRVRTLERLLGEGSPGGAPTLEDVDRLDWELWLLSFLVILLLLLAYVLNHSPELLGDFEYVLKPLELEVYVDGLAVLVLLFCLYVIQKHRQLNRARCEILLGQIEQESLARRLSVIECLFEVSSAAGEVVGKGEPLGEILESLRREMRADCACFWLSDPDRRRLELNAVAGESARKPGERIAFGSSFAGWVAERCEPLLLSEPIDFEAFTDLADTERRIASALLVPLVVEGLTHGVLGVEARSGNRTFTLGDRKLLQIFAGSLAAALAKNLLIEQLKESLQRVQEAQMQLIQTEKLASLGEMLAGISHELNNPLSVVVGHSELLLRSEDVGPETRERLEKMSQEAMRAKRLLENLLRIAREDGSPREPADMNEVVRQSVGMLHYQLNLDGIEAEMNLADELPATVLDTFGVQQLIFNIINNSRQAMRAVPAGQRHLYIRTEYLEEGTGAKEGPKPAVYLEIRDTGPGIPESDLSRVFDPFFTTKDMREGTGLGLSICYRTVQEHGGAIEVGNHPDGGALFSIWLPVDLEAKLPGKKPEPAGPRESAPLEPGTVLIVDDEVRVREVLEEVFTLLGHTVISAGNGKEALERIEEGDPPDAIVLDLKMPVMSGQECYEEIVKRSPRLAGRVLFLTGDTLSREARRFLADSDRPYLSKPFTFNELRDHVEALMRDDN